MRIVNYTQRIFNFPPLTIWPAEAKPKRAPGESVSVMTMPDGAVASPVRVYPGVVAPPGVTVDQLSRQPAHGEMEGDVPRVKLAETHGPDYWEIIKDRAKKHVANGDIVFRGDDEAESREEESLRKMGEKARAAPSIKGKPDAQALQFIELEDRKEALLAWRAEGGLTPRVKRALNDKIAGLK